MCLEHSFVFAKQRQSSEKRFTRNLFLTGRASRKDHLPPISQYPCTWFSFLHSLTAGISLPIWAKRLVSAQKFRHNGISTASHMNSMKPARSSRKHMRGMSATRDGSNPGDFTHACQQRHAHHSRPACLRIQPWDPACCPWKSSS